MSTACFGPAALRRAGAAARLLGWRPGDFWASTPAELDTALTAPGDAPPLGRDEFNRLMDHEHAEPR